MKLRLLVLLMFAYPLVAQPSSGAFVDMGGDVIRYYGHTPTGHADLDYTIQYSWSITREPNGDKAFTFSAKYCDYQTSVQILPGVYIWVALAYPHCYPQSESEALTLGPISTALNEFYNYHPFAYHLPPVYNPKAVNSTAELFDFRSYARAPHPLLTTEQPATQPNPQMTFLDGLSYNLDRFDLVTNKIVSQVVVPSTSGPLGIRPTQTGPQNEVWVANGGLEVSVADLGSQTLVTNIQTPSVPQASVPVGIVFTNDGATALEAIRYFSKDSAGNNGALLVFDAANRKVTATVPLKYGPTALLMAPDALTAYLLSDDGHLTYYDILSGTADLTVSTYTPGQQGGYPGASANVFIHPDGTRLFWNINTLLVAFDLTTHKVSEVISSGLPSTLGASMQMSQDGASIWLFNSAGTVAAYDVRSDALLGTFTTSPGSYLYPGPAN